MNETPKIKRYFSFRNASLCSSIILIALFVSLVPSRVFSASGVPTILGYQGRLANSSGDLLGGAGTNYYFKFSIWDSSSISSGNRLWPSTSPTSVSLNVKQGVFSANIGDTASGFPNALDYDFNTNKDVYLQVDLQRRPSILWRYTWSAATGAGWEEIGGGSGSLVGATQCDS
jgi:hypothetical protein